MVLGRPLISAGDLGVAQHALSGLLDKHADIYRLESVTEVYPDTPLYTNRPCSVEIINRLSSPAAPTPDAPDVTVRFDLRFLVTEDVRPTDEIVVTDQDPVLRYHVVGVHTPADYAVFTFADCELV